MLSRTTMRFAAAAAVAIAIGGGAYGIVSATASTGSGAPSAASSLPALSGQGVPRLGGSNARSGPAAGGSSGTVAGVSTSSFTISTSAGQHVTVDEVSSTTYRKGTGTTAAGVTKGESVVVLGITNGTTITAGQVIVQATHGGGATSSSAASVVPFQRGAQSTSKQAGQIPADYTQGTGTIVSGTAADKATKAALAAYPGGIVDRVVKLSDGEYEVHNIGVSWPHHIFVSQNYKVVGAD